MKGLSALIRRSLTVMLVVSLVWASSASAKTIGRPTTPDVTDEIVSLATRADAFVQRNQDGTFSLTGNARALQVSQEAFDRFAKALAGINDGIREGYLTSDSTGNIHLSNRQSPTGDATSEWGFCTGYSLRLTELQTVKLEGLLNMVAGGATGVAVVAAFIAAVAPPSIPVAAPVALAAGIVGSGAWFFAAWMQWVDNGNGDTIKYGYCAGGTIGYVYPVGN